LKQNIRILKPGFQKISTLYETNALYFSIKDCIQTNMRKRIKIESKLDNLRIVENVIDEATFEIGISKENYGKILVSILEAVNNAILHGNKSEPEKFVDIELFYKSNILKIKVTDEGKGFKPEKIPDPTIPENIESLNGRGVFIMSRLADEIKYSKRGNTVTMTFKNILA
jgi:serine/threonine-protein kinase RsbW